MADRYIFTTPDGDVVELNPNEDSQIAIAINGSPTDWAMIHKMPIEPLPEHLQPVNQKEPPTGCGTNSNFNSEPTQEREGTCSQ